MDVNHRLVAVLSDSYSGPSSGAVATLRVPAGVTSGWLIARADVQCDHTPHSERSLCLSLFKDGELLKTAAVPFVINERGQGFTEGELQALATGAGVYEVRATVQAGDKSIPVYTGMPHFNKRIEHLSLIKKPS